MSDFPEHVHPAGSSKAKLTRLTNAQPKLNEFTVGARSAKPNGLAAKGSKLEAMGMQYQQQKKRKPKTK